MLCLLPTALRALALARLPLEAEEAVLSRLCAQLQQPHADQLATSLRRIWDLSGARGDFVSVGSGWKWMGFQREDPTTDIRGGGALAVRFMEHMLDEQSGAGQLGRPMLLLRSRRDEGESIGYPWAAATINVVRLVSTRFDLVTPGGAPAGPERRTARLTWHLVRSETDFLWLATAAMALVDALWRELNASYMAFGAVLQAAGNELDRFMLAARADDSALDVCCAVLQRCGADDMLAALQARFVATVEPSTALLPLEALIDIDDVAAPSLAPPPTVFDAPAPVLSPALPDSGLRHRRPLGAGSHGEGASDAMGGTAWGGMSREAQRASSGSDSSFALRNMALAL